MSWRYGTLATEIYEQDKPIGHSFGDVEEYRRLLDGVTGRILEPAVGTGRMLIPLLESGLDVEGFDTSPEMLGVCRAHCRERGLNPVLRQADMTTFVRPGAYAAVIVPTGTIALLDGRADTLQALTCFRECLQPSGRLLVDLDPPPEPGHETDPEPMRHWWAGPDLWTLQVHHIEYDPGGPPDHPVAAVREVGGRHAGRDRAAGVPAAALGAGRVHGPADRGGVRRRRRDGRLPENCPPGPASRIWTFRAARP